jgi:hypothetical protein
MSRIEQEHATDVRNQREAQRRYSILNVLDPSNANAREQQTGYGVVLPPSSWGDGSGIVHAQQRRHDHLRPITGAPALNGVFLGAANFVEHVDLGYANVAGAPPTKVKGETYTTGLPSNMPWGMQLGEDEERKGVIIVVNVAEGSPSFHMEIRPGDRLLGVEGNYFKNEIDMGMVSQSIGTFKRQKMESGDELVYMNFVREPEDPYKRLKEEARLAARNQQAGEAVQQDPIVAVCERYAEDLQVSVGSR